MATQRFVASLLFALPFVVASELVRDECDECDECDLSRDECEDVTRSLCELNVSDAFYHAGIASNRRAKVQQDWHRGTV